MTEENRDKLVGWSNSKSGEKAVNTTAIQCFWQTILIWSTGSKLQIKPQTTQKFGGSDYHGGKL
jgi:hypothetical protein